MNTLTLRGQEINHTNSRVIITAGLGVFLLTGPSTILFDVWFYFTGWSKNGYPDLVLE